jgi:hypothetical protein
MPQIIRIVGEKKRPIPPRTFMGFQLDKNDKYNGKPLQHWLDMADELVMSTIIRGINPDKLSLVQTVAAERLKGLAMALNPNLYYKLSEERDRCRRAIPEILGQMLGWETKGQHFCAAHAPVVKKPAKKRRKKTTKKSNRVDPLD